MQLPNFTAEASIYHTTVHYRHTAGGSLLAHDNGNVIPQDCGLFKGIFCGVTVGATTVACGAICAEAVATAGASLAPCYVCVTAALGAVYGVCKDCLPGWIRDIINLFESGGGGGGGGGGGPIPCCPPGRRCCGTCQVRPDGRGLFCDDICVGPGQSCP